jgi:hypothetical protein
MEFVRNNKYTLWAVTLVTALMLMLMPFVTSPAEAHKACRNTHHHHYTNVDGRLVDIHWVAKVSQAGPNQLRYDWYAGRNAHSTGGQYKGYIIC